jgi:hypothetical protein
MSVTRPKSRPTARKARRNARGALGKVPGPSSNPATNLMIIDIAMRGASMVLWRGMEKALLRARYDSEKASDIVEGRSIIKTAAATGAARMATRSVPGFLLVAGGLFAKAVFDRSLRPREAARRGDEDLAEQAAQADEG